ncbi:MAG: lipopolysaccharide biosynthesis protein [Rhodobacteraceae bacterium]|nr:lipopolysaccharide biosynthesis protein [Paracoccaceae bacterium]
MNLDFKYYFSVFLRRSPYFVLVAALFASVGLTLAMILPPEFEGRATLLVESPQIPANLASSTVTTQAPEQLQIIQQRMMTRDNLLDIANQLKVYERSKKKGEGMSVADKIDDMRSRTQFTTTGGTSKVRGAPPNATVLSITFDADSPIVAAEVTNEFVTRVLQQNVQIRTEQAGDTLEFFKQEVARLGTELDSQSARLLEFQNQAGIAVPANLTFLQGQLTGLDNLITSRRQQIQSLQDQKQRITDLYNATGGVQTTGQQLTPLQQQLNTIEQQYNNAKLIYSDQNPKLLILESQYKQLQKQVADQMAANSGLPTGSGSAPISQQQAMYESQIAALDSQIAGLQQEIDNAKAKMDEVNADISKVAENGATLTKLQRDITAVQNQYNNAVSRLSAADTGERIELLAKGQRISVIEQATPPQDPIKPDRLMIAGAGIGGGFAAGLALVVLLELLNRSIRRPVELTNRLGITPIAVLPYIRTDRELFMRKMVYLGAVAVFVIGIPVSLYAVHTFVTPLDVLIEPALNKIGFSVTG